MKISQKSKGLDSFVQAVLRQDIQVGEVLRRTELCEKLEISMSPLRELLVLLEELELVEVKPRAGFKIIYPSLDFMSENMRFRVMIENSAIEAFAGNVRPDWINDQLIKHKDAIAGLEEAEDLQEWNDYIVDFDRAFHRTIVAALDNKAVTKAHEYIQTKLRIARLVHRRVPPRKTNLIAMQDHLAILDALKTGDLGNVRTALDAHFVQSVRNTLVGY
ncbi:MAG: GntR family transcriptional regulator [Tateyamaria sp.]|uniref:GntR family transcriptional regulator n=1 Tax=Tateyamaria sp. TaxID=1929288 RepID=UPI00329CCAB6